MPRTKIICTIGPASRSPDILRRLVLEGMDIARLNLAHGDCAEHAESVRRIREAAAAVGRPVAIQVDLQGPKLRVGKMADPGVLLAEGEQVTLTTEDGVGHGPEAIPVQAKDFPRLVSPGDRILLDDGTIELQVLSVNQKVHCRVVVEGLLKSNKGINLPGISVDLPSLTDKDRQDLRQALAWGVDWIALSFVRTASAIHECKALIREFAPASFPTPVMAKIEKPQALMNMDEIIAAADAIMVARGDLGIEIPPEEVPIQQKRIVQLCNKASVPVVIATQMLESMVHNPRPTRAEASDVANAILDGTDAMMLSGETSIGAYPVQALETMVRITREVEQHQPELHTTIPGALQEDPVRSVAGAVSHAARDVAHNLRAAAIITPTASGYTARLMAGSRPQVPIIAVTPDPQVQRRSMLYWGVTPVLARRTESTDDMIELAAQAAREHGLIQNGDTVIITAGAARSEPGTTNLLQVLVVGQARSA